MFEILAKTQLKQTEEYIRKMFAEEATGHDWWHIYRVRNLAVLISKSEGGNRFLIEMAALLHDLDDWKINRSNSQPLTESFLKNIQVERNEIIKIMEIIDQVSFKGAGTETATNSIEAAIVQDADRLDAIGAIGIARTFAFGGIKERPIYSPDIEPVLQADFENYKKNNGPTINHFYEKLLLLKNRLNTTTAIEMAKKRHIFMERFLEQFFNEWSESSYGD
jgi:uncharacterized protein